MAEKIHGFIDEEKGMLTIWFSGDDPKDVRLIGRIKQAFVSELNKRFGEEDWDSCREVLETGAKVSQFLELMKEEEERRAEDAAL